MHVVALDVATGEVVWDTTIGDFRRRESLNGGPLVARGKVMIGTTGTGVAARFGGPQIVGLDAETGEIAWRLGTIAKPGEPGGESWNGIPFEAQRRVDLDAGQLRSANRPRLLRHRQHLRHGPAAEPNAPGTTSDALYTNSTLAVNPDTGALVWHFQHFPNDQWDLDWAFERQILDVPVNGATRRVVLTAGKIGIYDAVDARTGEFVFSIDLGLNNIVTEIDTRTGEKRVDRSPLSRRHRAARLPARRGREEFPAGRVHRVAPRRRRAAQRSVHGSSRCPAAAAAGFRRA